MRTEIIRCATLSSLCRCVELFKLSAFCRATVGRFIDTCVSRIANYLFNSMFSVHSSMRWFSGKMLFSEQRFKARIANCFGCGYNMIWQVSEDASSVFYFWRSIGSKLFWKSVKKLPFFGNIHQMYTNCKTSCVVGFGETSPSLRELSVCIPSWIWKKKDSNLVDSASSIRLSQRLSHARLSISDYTVKLRMAHYISYSLFDSQLYLDNRSNSRANTCVKGASRLLYLLDTISPSGLDES